MSKRHPNRPAAEKTAPPSTADEAAPLPWSPRARGIISALILFHLTAVVVAALVASPPYSELWMDIAEVFRPYVNAADLNHGYRFFAPDPGPAHLVRYHLEFADGTKRDGQFPNLDEQRPRLLYHRYFMLSEHLFGQYSDWRRMSELSEKPFPPDMKKQIVEGAADAERLYLATAQSYAEELLRRTGAKRVTLELVEHRLPNAYDVAHDHQRLDDPRLYSVADTLGPFSETGVVEELP